MIALLILIRIEAALAEAEDLVTLICCNYLHIEYLAIKFIHL